MKESGGELLTLQWYYTDAMVLYNGLHSDACQKTYENFINIPKERICDNTEAEKAHSILELAVERKNKK